jgi:hypothetical protein
LGEEEKARGEKREKKMTWKNIVRERHIKLRVIVGEKERLLHGPNTYACPSSPLTGRIISFGELM